MYIDHKIADTIHTILGIEGDRYLFESLTVHTGVTSITGHYDIVGFDESEKYYYKKIKDTKIARKLNKNNIEKEEKGWLWVNY